MHYPGLHPRRRWPRYSIRGSLWWEAWLSLRYKWWGLVMAVYHHYDKAGDAWCAVSTCKNHAPPSCYCAEHDGSLTDVIARWYLVWYREDY